MSYVYRRAFIHYKNFSKFSIINQKYIVGYLPIYTWIDKLYKYKFYQSKFLKITRYQYLGTSCLPSQKIEFIEKLMIELVHSLEASVVVLQLKDFALRINHNQYYHNSKWNLVRHLGRICLTFDLSNYAIHVWIDNHETCIYTLLLRR